MLAFLRSGFHIHAIIPVSLLCSLLAILLTWHQHDVKIDSPLLATKVQALAWGDRVAGEQSCLKSSIDYRVQGQGDAAVTGTDGPWFGTLRCNKTPRVYWRIGAMVIVPYLVIAIVGGIFFPPEKKPKD